MHDKEFEERLVEWVKSQRERKLRVSRRLIQIQAQKMALALTNEDDEEIVFKVIFLRYFLTFMEHGVPKCVQKWGQTKIVSKTAYFFFFMTALL